MEDESTGLFAGDGARLMIIAILAEPFCPLVCTGEVEVSRASALEAKQQHNTSQLSNNPGR